MFAKKKTKILNKIKILPQFNGKLDRANKLQLYLKLVSKMIQKKKIKLSKHLKFN